MKMTDLPVILASGSPRRVEMLRKDGLDPYILKPQCEEVLHTDLAPHQVVMALALKKGLAAEAALQAMAEEDRPQAKDGKYIIISSDTIVAKGVRIFGKPQSKAEAEEMIRAIRNDVHQVYSGVFLNIYGTDHRILFCERTDVHVKDFPDQWIADYIATEEPMDKAGAYAIQGAFGCNIDRIEGCYDNVVGMPYERLKKELEKILL